MTLNTPSERYTPLTMRKYMSWNWFAMLNMATGEDMLKREAPALTLAPAPTAAWVDWAAAAYCAVTTKTLIHIH